MERIDISVIIPVYNVEKYLAECLDSVLSQDMYNVEIICVNDGSEDGSRDILENYAERDSRIMIIDQKNQGLSCARNAGINRAQGEYLLFLDSDDCLSEQALDRLYHTAQAEKLEILAFDAECFYETEELHDREYKDDYYRRKKDYSKIQTGEALFCELMENDDFCDAACLLFIKNSWLKEEKICFMPGILHEDCLFSFQCYMNAKRISHRKWGFLRYRVREGSIMTSKLSFANLRGRLVCYREILKFLLYGGLSKKTEIAVVQFLRFIMYNIIYTDLALEEKQEEEAGKLAETERLLLENMRIGRSGRYSMDSDIYLVGFQALVQSYRRILLYGAGKIGRLVWDYLKRLDMSDRVTGFAVSDVVDSQEEIEGKRIRQIFRYVADESTLVLITARYDYQPSMIKNAEKVGFQRIKVIDFRLEQMLRREMARKL